MAESSGFFNAELVNGQYDREYLAEAYAKYFSLFIANGVFPNPSDGLQVFENTTADMNVLMHPGYAWIDGYWYKLDGNLTLAIDPADGVLNRIDSIVVRWDLEKRGIYAKVVKGTPASVPTAPEVMRSPDFSDLCVAHIRVDAGTTKIMQSMITDTRMNTSLCGIVTGVVQSIDTTTLFEQYQAALKEFQDTRMVEFDEWQEQEKSDFDAWFETIKGTLDGDTAGNLLNLITQETADRKAADAAIESKIGINGTATYEESTVKITAPEGIVVVTFLAPSDCKAGDKYTLNGTSLTLTDLNGEPVEDAWKQGSPVTFTISGNKAFFKAGGGAGKLPSDLAPLCPNFKVERNGGKVKITADKIQLNSLTSMVSGGVWAWGKTRPVKPTGTNLKQWSRAELITTSKPYDGLYLGDVKASDGVTETLIYLPENQNGKVVLAPYIALSINYLGGVYITRLYTESEWLGAFGNNSTYAGSTADNWFEKTFLGSILHESVASQVLTCDVPVMNQGTVSRRCWALSSRELDSASSEVGGEFMPYFSTNQRRIAYLDGGTIGGVYWMRTKSDASKVFTVTAQGGFGTQPSTYAPVAYRPAFVLPKDFKIQQRPDGSYTVWNEQGLMTLGDIGAQTVSTLADDEVPLEVEIDWPESEPLYARQWVYNEKGVYQTMLLGGIASTEGAPPFALPEFTGNHAIFGDETAGRIELYESGDLTLYPGTYDSFLVGGGGSGVFGGKIDGAYNPTGGGGAGYTVVDLARVIDNVTVVTVDVGAGGATNTTANGLSYNGSSSKLTFPTGTVIEAPGGGSKETLGLRSMGQGRAGGSGGGGGSDSLFTSGSKGGSDGANGENGRKQYSVETPIVGGAGQGTTTRLFAEEEGTLYAGGGGGQGSVATGGAGGGGQGGWASAGAAGTPNTGGGGGAGYKNARNSYQAGGGGSGIIIIRWNNA